MHARKRAGVRRLYARRELTRDRPARRPRTRIEELPRFAFIGGLRAGDRGLYVSTDGFTKEARYEADRANVPIRPLNLDAFVRHYVEVYDRVDDDTRFILPLTRIWWPA